MGVESDFGFVAPQGMKESYDHGLKLFLNDDDLERLYDFEEECMEGLAREKVPLRKPSIVD